MTNILPPDPETVPYEFGIGEIRRISPISRPYMCLQHIFITIFYIVPLSKLRYFEVFLKRNGWTV